MTVPISIDSPRRIHAARFATELRRAMKAAGASNKRLSEAAHVTTSALAQWRTGANLPLPDTAARLAEVLNAPELVKISRQARTKACRRCSRAYLALSGSMNQDYCSRDCRLVDAALRHPAQGSTLFAKVRGATDRRLAGAPEAETLPEVLDALREWNEGDAKAVARRDRLLEVLDARGAAIAAMCAGCEPEGLCRTEDCPLRAYSPLPLASEHVAMQLREPSSPHAPENKARWLASVQAANAARWSRPGERQAAGEASRARLAAMTLEEREERGRRISAGIDREKRSAASRAMHAARRASA